MHQVDNITDAPFTQADDARTLKVISFEVPSHPDDTEAIRSYMDLGRHRIVPGQESSPQLYHISRFGSKAIWLCQGDNITIQSVALPNLEKQMGGELPGTVKPIDLGSEVNMNRLRAFDMDEVCSDSLAYLYFILKLNSSDSSPIRSGRG